MNFQNAEASSPTATLYLAAGQDGFRPIVPVPGNAPVVDGRQFNRLPDAKWRLFDGLGQFLGYLFVHRGAGPDVFRLALYGKVGWKEDWHYRDPQCLAGFAAEHGLLDQPWRSPWCRTTRRYPRSV